VYELGPLVQAVNAMAAVQAAIRARAVQDTVTLCRFCRRTEGPDLFGGAPGPAVLDQLSLVQADDRFAEGVVMSVTDGAGGGRLTAS
jgi:hypothetical protein